MSFIFLVDTLLIFFEITGYNIGLVLINKYRLCPKVTILSGAALALSGFYLSSFAKSVPVYVAIYTGMNGLGTGLCYFVPLVASWEYFPQRKGLITGIILASYGIGSLIFSLISTKLVNPDGINPTIFVDGKAFFDYRVADRVPYMIRTLVYIWIIPISVAVLLIKRKPLETEEKELTDPAKDSDYQETGCEYYLKSLKCMFYSKRFWQYVGLMICGNFFATFFSYSYKEYGENS